MSTLSIHTFQERIFSPFVNFFNFPFPRFFCYIHFYSLSSKFPVLGEETANVCPPLDLLPNQAQKDDTAPPSGETM